MAVECFCGCGRQVKFTRRALNGTGALVQGQLDQWEAAEPALTESGEWTPGLTAFLETGEGVAGEMKAMTHGGKLRITASQREITDWINRSSAMLKQLAEGDTSGIAALPEPEPGPEDVSETDAGADDATSPEPVTAADREARRAEIEAIRAGYEAGEEEVNECPECGAVIPDPGEYLAHVSSAHPAG